MVSWIWSLGPSAREASQGGLDMFDGDTNIGLLDTALRNKSRADFNARQSNLHLMRLEEWRAHAKALEQEVASLQARIADLEAVRAAEHEALAAVTAEWRRVHPVSVLHDWVSKFRDGSGMRRNASIWIQAFDAAARRLGIGNPEAWRIS